MAGVPSFEHRSRALACAGLSHDPGDVHPRNGESIITTRRHEAEFSFFAHEEKITVIDDMSLDRSIEVWGRVRFRGDSEPLEFLTHAHGMHCASQLLGKRPRRCAGRSG